MRLIWRLGGKLHLPSETPAIAVCGTDNCSEEDWQEAPECRVCQEAMR